MDNGADDFYRGQTATVAIAATTAVAIVTALVLVFLV
jgi:hypothetical protein